MLKNYKLKTVYFKLLMKLVAYSLLLLLISNPIIVFSEEFTIHSKLSGGYWNSIETWEENRIPDENDKVEISGTVTLNTDIKVSGLFIQKNSTLTNNRENRTITITYTIINDGVICNEGTYNNPLYINILTDNVTNNGVWKNSQTRFYGNISREIITKKPIESHIIFYDDMEIINPIQLAGTVSLNNKTITFSSIEESGSIKFLGLNQVINGPGVITANSIIFEMTGSKIMSGNITFEGSFHNKQGVTLTNNREARTITITDTIVNDGVICNEGTYNNPLYINILTDNVTNNGAWKNSQTRFYGNISREIITKKPIESHIIFYDDMEIINPIQLAGTVSLNNKTITFSSKEESGSIRFLGANQIIYGPGTITAENIIFEVTGSKVISGDITLDGSVYNKQGVILTNNREPRTITINGKIVNDGAICNEGTYNNPLYINILTDNVTNNGAWKNSQTRFYGNISREIITKKPIESHIIFYDDMEIINPIQLAGTVSLNNKTITFSSKEESGSIRFLGANQIIYGPGTITAESIIFEVTGSKKISDGINLIGSVYNKQGVILTNNGNCDLTVKNDIENYGIIQDSSGKRFAINVKGNLTNKGYITNSGYKQLFISVSGEIYNDGYWSQDIIIPIYTLKANFRSSHTTGKFPLNVQFFDLSVGNPTNWQWDFDNDGIVDSEAQNPTFTYLTEGTYSVWLKIRKDNSTDEAFKNRYINVIGNLPDLQVTNIEHSSAIAGQAFEVKWSISNKGKKSTQSPLWYDYVYISPDNNDVRTGHHEDKLLGKTHNLSYLDPQDSYLQTQEFKIPHGISGLYYLFVITDSVDAMNINHDIGEFTGSHGGDIVNESNNMNNYMFVPINIEAPPSPDLTVSNILVPEKAISGQNIHLTWSITNKGENLYPNQLSKRRNQKVSDIAEFLTLWTDSVYISQDETFNGNAKLLKTIPIQCTDQCILKENEFRSISTTITLPYPKSGDYYIYILTDAYNSIYEYAYENNNLDRSENPIDIILPLTPDLKITNLIVPEKVESGRSIKIKWDVLNQGVNSTHSTEPYWLDKIFLLDVSHQSNFIPMNSFFQKGPLHSGAGYSKEEIIMIPNGMKGSYFCYIQTDYNNKVFEYLSEENNDYTSSQIINIELPKLPDLKAISIETPNTLTAGDIISITYSVKNIGEITTGYNSWNDYLYLSKYPGYSRSDIILKNYQINSPLDISETYTKTMNINIPTNISGDYFIKLKTDNNNTIYEYSYEDNNYTHSQLINVLPYPTIDLVIDNFDIPYSALSGQIINIHHTVRNIGQTTTLSSKWYDKYFISQDNFLSSNNDILLKTIAHSGAISANEAYTQNTIISLPEGISGTFYMIVQTDSDNNVSEVIESNNTFISPISIQLSPYPDLQLSNVDIPSSCIAGQSISISWTVENKGVKPKSSWFDSVYLSSNTTLDIGDICLSTAGIREILEKNKTYTRINNVQLPIYTKGNYYVFVKTDSRDDIYENFNTNNTAFKAIQIELLPPADLIVKEIEIPQNAIPGEPITINWTIENIGEHPAKGGMHEGVYISLDETWEFTDPILGVTSRQIDLLPGQSKRMAMKVNLNKTLSSNSKGSITDTMPGVALGKYFVIVKTDIKNNILEGNDSNNYLISEDVLNVNIPTIDPNTTIEAQLTKMKMKYFRIDVEEGFDLRVSLKSQTPGAHNEVYVGYNRVPSLIEYDFEGTNPFDQEQEILVPSTNEGTYYIMIIARELPQYSLHENVLLTAELLSFSIVDISPNFGGAGGNVTTLITGAGFRDTTRFYLKLSNNSMLQGERIDFINTMNAKVRWNLSNVSLGTYDLIAKNGVAITESRCFSVEKSTGMKYNIEKHSSEYFRGGGLSPISFNIINSGNIDIPYLIFNIIVPKEVITLSIENSKGLLKKSDLYKNYQVEDFLYGETSFDDINIEEYKSIELIAKDLSPNTSVKTNIIFSNLYPPNFSLLYQALPMTVTDYIQMVMNTIEQIRLNILESPESSDPDLILYATDKNYFTNLLLKPNYLNNNLIQQKDIDLFTNFEQNRSTKALDYFDIYSDLPYKRVLYKRNNSTRSRPSPSAFNKCRVDMWKKCVEKHDWVCLFSGMTPSQSSTEIIIGGGSNYATTGPCNLVVQILCTTHQFYCLPIVMSIDPNEIIGPEGFDNKKWINNDMILSYNVLFENDSEFATAPAQKVTIKQILDDNINIQTFQLGSFGFAGKTFNISNNKSFYSNRIDLRDSLGIYVDITAGIDIEKNEAFWIFNSIDPNTGQQPIDPFTGLLPVNNPENHEGEGFVAYTVQSKEHIVTGDVIHAKAQIIFDINEPIDTPEIFNTIDADDPTSNLYTDIQKTDKLSFSVFWSGDDIEGGSGLLGYDIYVSKDGEPFEKWLENTTNTSEIFNGEPGHTYQFYSLAKDNAGNIEKKPLEPDEIVRIISYEPQNPNPQENSIDIEKTLTLSWGTEYTLSTYDIVLWENGHEKPDQPIAKDLTQTNYSVIETLSYSTTYLWQITSHRLDGSTKGPIWRFTTVKNNSPEAFDQYIEINEDNSINFHISGTDNDNDPIDFIITEAPQHGILTGTAPDLKYTPQKHYSGMDNIVFIVNDGLSNSNSALVTITVIPVADMPILSLIEKLSVLEDTELDLQIDNPVLVDNDKSESLNPVKILGVPEDAKLSTGFKDNDDTWTISIDELADLKLTPPLNSGNDFTLTVIVSSTEVGNADTATTNKVIEIDIVPVADPPLLSVLNNSRALEDTDILLQIDPPVLIDNDNSEELNPVVISGVPEKATLSAGTKNNDGTWKILPHQLANLTLTPELNSGNDFALTISVTSTEKENGDIATTRKFIEVDLIPVADKPLLTLVNKAQGAEDTNIILQINPPVLVDNDNSEILKNVIITGLPANATLSSGDKNIDGYWTLLPEQLTGLTLSPPSNFGGDFILSINATSSEKENEDSSTVSKLIEVEIIPVADPPILILNKNAKGLEDTEILLQIDTPLLVDNDQSEKIDLIQISDVPEKATLTSGQKNLDGTWTIDIKELSGLSILPALNSTNSFTLNISARTIEKENNDTAETSKQISVTIIPVNDLPEISKIESQHTYENISTKPIYFTIFDIETPPSNLTVTSVSSNTSLLPNDSYIMINCEHSECFAILKPADKEYGKSIITLTVSDEESLTSKSSFDLTVYNVVKPGDINDNGIIDLEDADIVNQILTGCFEGNYFIEADINEDGRIGLQEFIYILKYIDNLPAYGDIDNNKKIDLIDFITILQILTDIDYHRIQNICIEAEINNDNQIGIEEAIYIIKTLSQ